MLILSLLELAFDQLFFNHMRASVCVPVSGCSCYLIDVSVITFELLSSHASPVFVRAGLRPPLFLMTCVSVSVYLPEAPAVI